MARNPIIRENPPEVPTPTEETPHACMGGWVFLGYEDEDGEEVIEAVPCKRCRQERR
jgi:hypothetical protein